MTYGDLIRALDDTALAVELAQWQSPHPTAAKVDKILRYLQMSVPNIPGYSAPKTFPWHNQVYQEHHDLLIASLMEAAEAEAGNDDY